MTRSVRIDIIVNICRRCWTLSQKESGVEKSGCRLGEATFMTSTRGKYLIPEQAQQPIIDALEDAHHGQPADPIVVGARSSQRMKASRTREELSGLRNPPKQGTLDLMGVFVGRCGACRGPFSLEENLNRYNIINVPFP